MPKCSICEKTQGVLNEGNLCKSCYRIKLNSPNNISISGNMDKDSIDESYESRFYNVVKQMMAKEKFWNNTLFDVMNEQILHLKNEITQKTRQ